MSEKSRTAQIRRTISVTIEAHDRLIAEVVRQTAQAGRPVSKTEVISQLIINTLPPVATENGHNADATGQRGAHKKKH